MLRSGPDRCAGGSGRTSSRVGSPMLPGRTRSASRTTPPAGRGRRNGSRRSTSPDVHSSGMRRRRWLCAPGPCARTGEEGGSGRSDRPTGRCGADRRAAALRRCWLQLPHSSSPQTARPSENADGPGSPSQTPGLPGGLRHGAGERGSDKQPGRNSDFTVDLRTQLGAQTLLLAAKKESVFPGSRLKFGPGNNRGGRRVSAFHRWSRPASQTGTGLLARLAQGRRIRLYQAGGAKHTA